MSTISRLASALVLCGLFLLGSEPLAAATYYVSTSGNDANDGKSPQQAWRTVKFAATKAVAGDKVFIKAGNYGPEIVTIKNSGTEKAPIVFQGYKAEPGDTPDPKYKPGDELDANALPVLDGGQTGKAIELGRSRHIEIRNLGITRYSAGLNARGAHNILMEGLYITNIDEKTGGYNVGIYLDGHCEYCVIRNCVLTDCSGVQILVRRTNNSIVENCRTYGVKTEPSAIAPDYYIGIADGSNNVIRNCLAENLHGSIRNLHSGHGIGIKDQATRTGYPDGPSHDNKIIDCVARNMGEYFYVAHGARNNEFVNCRAYGDYAHQSRWSEGINIRDGAHDNTFRNCRVEGAHTSIAFQDTTEGPRNPDGSEKEQICSKNTLVNCVFADSNYGIELWNADNNLFDNCVFVNVGKTTFCEYSRPRHDKGNICRNVIVMGSHGALRRDGNGSGNEILFTYSDFWNNSFAMPAGEGNMAKDPLFADLAKKDFHLKSQAGRWVKDGQWTKDGVTSPCIDAGNPSDEYSAESQPNGGRINIGAYGNSPEASKSPSR